MDLDQEKVGSQSRRQFQSVSQPLLSWLARHWDVLAMFLLVLASMPAMWVSPRSLVILRDSRWHMIDDNWNLDEVFKLSRGIWIGRDVAFTHGLIFQWLSSLPTGIMGLSVGGIYATWFTVPMWCAFLCVYLTLRLLLPEQPAWKRALLLLLLCIFWGPPLRTMLPLLLFAFFLRGWYAVIEGRARAYTFGSVSALLCVTAFLTASDTGVYALAAWLIATAAFAIETGSDQPIAATLGFTLLAFALSAFILALTVNAAMARPFDFRFWKDSAHMASVYRWATPAAMTRRGTARFFTTLFVGAAVFLFRAGTRGQHNPVMTARAGFLLGGFAFALVMLQTALVRSDLEHVAIGAFAMVFLAGAILFAFESRRLSSLAIGSAIIGSVLLANPAFRPSALFPLAAQARRPLGECPIGFREFDRGCFVMEYTGMLQSASSYLSQHSGPQDHIVVFPYQTKFGIASRRNVAGGLMQAYTASGQYLSQLEIAGLERTIAPAGLYLPDADMAYLSDAELAHRRSMDAGLPVDGIYNFTRIPEVWFWMMQHYRAEQQVWPGIFGLRRDDSRAARISMLSQPLGLAAQTYLIHQRASEVDLGMPAWPPGADFLKLRLMVGYAFWWRLLKPERMQLEITRADGTIEPRWFVLQPNVATDVWVYPWSPPELIHYFEANESLWRTTPHLAIIHLRLRTMPLDWVSVRPDWIAIQSAEAVRFSMAN
jgi:hypothetical protein